MNYVEDIMIGDWIKYNYSENDWKYIRIENGKHLDQLKDDKNWEPVMLTKEILLKNDFHRNTKLGIPELYSCKSLQKHVVSIFYGDVKSKELIWSLGDTDDVFIICTYVHDLQHLLKLLRIKKNIEL